MSTFRRFLLLRPTSSTLNPMIIQSVSNQNNGIVNNNNKYLLLNLNYNRNLFSTLSTKKLYDYSSLDKSAQNLVKAREKLRLNRKLPKYILRRSSIFLYEACTDGIKLENFIEQLNLEDTFNTWFFITKLHVWLICARCMSENEQIGLIIRNELIERMWEDCSNRLNKLTMMKTKLKKESLQTLNHQFNASLLALDEGILSDDIVLAGAIWRTVLGMSGEPDLIQLERLVGYIRQQAQHLATIKSEPMLFRGEISWKSIPPLI